MNTSRIVVVTGFGRCGSSAMMSMLNAGGMEVFADESPYPTFESHHIQKLRSMQRPEKIALLRRCVGKAVKELSPLDRQLPPSEEWEYDFIFMNRNTRQQSLSTAKFLRMIGGESVNEQGRLKLELSLRKEAPQVMGVLSRQGRVLEVQFEAMLSSPNFVAQTVKTFLQESGHQPLDVEKMASVIIPRSPTNFPGMLELTLKNKRQ